MRGTGNKYVYADNNPLSKVDVYGLETVTIVMNGLDLGVTTLGEPEDMRLEITESHPPSSTQTSGQSPTTPDQSAQNTAAAAAAAPTLVEGGEAALAAAANKMLTVAADLLGVVADALSVPVIVVLTPTQLNSDENAQMAKIHAAEDNAASDSKAEPQSEPGTSKDRSARGAEEQLKDMEREKAASDSGKRKRPVDSIGKSEQNFKKAVRDNPSIKDWEQ